MNKITVVLGKSLGTINPDIYGHFSEHIGGVFYDGLWVGEDSKIENIHGFRKALVDSFKKIAPPVLRWPGGCFAETYNWRDGIGPREKRPRRIGWWYYRDQRTESNAVGTHEFIDFCELTGAKPYFAANMTSTTPQDIREWIEYCNLPQGASTLTDLRAANGHPDPMRIAYWGIGNENWGGGGRMSPEDCAKAFLRYATLAENVMPGQLKFMICGANGHDIAWTRRLLGEWAERPDYHESKMYGMSVHYYCGTSGTPQEFTDDQWKQLLFQAAYMKHIVEDHRAAMDEYDPKREIGLVVDEWGCWHKDGTGPSKGYNLFEQQSNMRDAVVAALTLNIFNNHCDVVQMANVAQLCNNLHSLYLAHEENFVETPNYHVFDMYKAHQGAKQLMTIVDAKEMTREGFDAMQELSVSASEKDGKVTITIANLCVDEAKEIEIAALGDAAFGKGTMTVLSSDDPHTCNTFENPFAVTPVTKEIDLSANKVITVPAASVTMLSIDSAAKIV